VNDGRRHSELLILEGEKWKSDAIVLNSPEAEKGTDGEKLFSFWVDSRTKGESEKRAPSESEITCQGA
jgi:hypothetical protein